MEDQKSSADSESPQPSIEELRKRRGGPKWIVATAITMAVLALLPYLIWILLPVERSSGPLTIDARPAGFMSESFIVTIKNEGATPVSVSLISPRSGSARPGSRWGSLMREYQPGESDTIKFTTGNAATPSRLPILAKRRFQGQGSYIDVWIFRWGMKLIAVK